MSKFEFALMQLREYGSADHGWKDKIRAELARATKERDEAVNRRNIAIQEFKDSQRELAALKAEHGAISKETREVERLFSLNDRVRAVTTMYHARDYLMASDCEMVPRIQACTILFDGIANALDGRSTGREWRTIRHRYSNSRDGAAVPSVEPGDYRCYDCGALKVQDFTPCWEHRPARIDAARAAGKDKVDAGS